MRERARIGLALGAGGARGFAHIGVLEVLEENQIPIDYIAGSSMGALVGTLAACGHTSVELKRFAHLFRRKNFLDFTVPKMGLITGKRLHELIYMLSKGRSFEDLEPPVTVVATNVNSGKRVLLQTGLISSAVRASISIPGIFVPVRREGELLIDGGIIDRVPAQVVKEMGADIVVAVDVSYFPRKPEVASIYDVILQSMEIMSRELVKANHINADVLLRPIVKQHSTIVFEEVSHLITQGREEALRQLPHIKDKIARWKGGES